VSAEKETERAVDAMVRALFDRGFRLGGSRRMAQKFPDAVVIGPHTDWDFYGDESHANHNLLQMMGFGLLDCPNRDYWDDLLVSMYQHPTMPIQVLLRSDTETYTSAFESIDSTTFVTKLWKSSPLLLDYMSGGHFKETVRAYFNELFRSMTPTPPSQESANPYPNGDELK